MANKELLVPLKELFLEPSKIEKNGINFKFLENPTKNNSMYSKTEINRIARYDIDKLVEEVVEHNTKGDFIVKSEIGKAKNVCPDVYPRLSKKTMVFETNNFKICFMGSAIDFFSKNIVKLQKRTLKDCYDYLNSTIILNPSKNFKIIIDEVNDEQNKGISVNAHKNIVYLKPGEEIVYRHLVYQEEKIEDEEIEYLLSLIDTYHSVNGDFKTVSHNRINLQASNRGTISVDGLDRVPELREKTLSLFRKEG